MELQDNRGMQLTEKIDMDFLRDLRPQYHKDYIKFVVNMQTGTAAVGMEVHRDCSAYLGAPENLLGGNIFWDGSIIYESGLNIDSNLELGDFTVDARTIENKDLIGKIDSILFQWVEL